jgi:D-3-phosphoglycerate dehydrogenase
VKILNIEPEGYSSEARELLQTVGELKESYFNPEELINEIQDVDILIVRLKNQIDSKLIDAAHKLKIIATATTGLDHIDEEYAAKKGIKIISLKGETDFLDDVWATAEHTWALLLSLLRKIPSAFYDVSQGN